MARGASTVAILVAALALSSGATAQPRDGDPASDVLVFRNVFVPYPAPRADAVASVEAAVARVYAGDDRIKVAVVASPGDLGSVTSLFGKPADYARFLSLELRTVYVGPLLVVMAAGYGVYDGGRSTAAEQRVLSGVPAPGASAEELMRAAAATVERLRTAHALVSRDVLAPAVAGIPVLARPGARVALKYTVSEDGGWSRELVQARVGGAVVATLRRPFHAVRPAATVYVVWKVPANVPATGVSFCVTAWDRAGNRSRRACAAVHVV